MISTKKKLIFIFIFLSNPGALFSKQDTHLNAQLLSNLSAKTAKRLENWATHIIVGCGAAGSVVAARLAENPDNNVLVIELGPNNLGHSFIETPGKNFLLWDNPFGPQPSPSSLAFETKKQDGRTYRYPRGNGFGGSTNHHSLIDGRGSAQIYDKIAQLVGDSRWAYQNILPYYKKMENYHGSSENKSYRGNTGWLQVIQHEGKSPLHADFMQAAHKTTGAPIRKDLSSDPKKADGISLVNLHVTPEGQRSAAFENLLLPLMMKQKNVIVLFNTLVTKVLIEEKDDTLRAVGVDVFHKPRAYHVDNSLKDTKSNSAPLKVRFNAQKEIILSGGAINTPQLLLLSGVGPAQHLKEIGIPVILDKPGVGSNLLDHHEVAITYEVDADKLIWPTQATNILDTVDAELNKTKNENKKAELLALRARVLPFADKTEQRIGKGSIILDWHSGLKSDVGHDLHIAASEGFWFDFDFKSLEKLPDGKQRAEYFMSEEIINAPNFPRVFHHFLLEIIKITKSAGSIRLANSNPSAQPIIDLALYQDDEAVERMAHGIQMVRKIAQHPDLKKYYKLDSAGNPIEIFPGPEVKTIDELKAYLKRWSAFGHHIAGTAQMGRTDNPSAVVDTHLRVIGIPNLRVIDTSVYPSPYLHGYNTARAAYLIGEVGADLIKEDAKQKSAAKLK